MEILQIITGLIEEKGHAHQVISYRDHTIVKVVGTGLEFRINRDLEVFYVDWTDTHWTRTSKPIAKYHYIGNLMTSEGSKALEKTLNPLTKTKSPKPEPPKVVKRKYQ